MLLRKLRPERKRSMDNWQEEISLLEAQGHIAFLEESLSTLSSMCATLTAQIDSLKLQLATAQDERDAAVYAKSQLKEAAEALRAEMTARTAAFQAQSATLQGALDDAVNGKAQFELEAANLRSQLGQVTAQSEKAMAERASEIDSLLAALKSSEETVEQTQDDLASLRGELTAGTAWQAKVPSLTLLGQSLARLPGYKALAADAAINADRLPIVRTAFQDLATVHGIGVAYEQRLYNAGVGTYWELAHLSDDDFVSMLQLGDLQRKVIDLDAIRGDARRLAVEADAVGVLWEGETPDDFEPIPGIGKVFEQRLYDAGIRSYRTLAAATVEDLAAICQAHTPVAPDFAAWIEQAKTLNAERRQQRANAG
jgi:predicted flap endonuclease-1-like 5' DNA nuclease